MMFCGHIDTVGVAGMTDPVDPSRAQWTHPRARVAGHEKRHCRDDWCRARDCGIRRAQRRQFVDRMCRRREHSSIGADALVTNYRADAAVVTEPTDLQVAVGAQKASSGWKLKPKAAPRTGAARAMGATRFCEWGGCWDPSKLLIDRWNLSAGGASAARYRVPARVVDRGRPRNSVSYPIAGSAQIERRTIPAEAADASGREVETILAASFGRCRLFPSPAASHVMFHRPPYEIHAAHELPGR